MNRNPVAPPPRDSSSFCLTWALSNRFAPSRPTTKLASLESNNRESPVIMRTLDDALLELVTAGRIAPADAWRNAVNNPRFADYAPAAPAKEA